MLAVIGTEMFVFMILTRLILMRLDALKLMKMRCFPLIIPDISLKIQRIRAKK